MGALSLLWKHPVCGRISCCCGKIGTCNFWSDWCCCAKIGTCNLVRLLLLWKIWDLQFVAGLLILLCKNSDLQFGDILVGPKTHFQNLKFFFLLPSYKVLEE